MNTIEEIPASLINSAQSLAASDPEKYDAAVAKSVRAYLTSPQTMPATATEFLEKVVLAVHFDI